MPMRHFDAHLISQGAAGCDKRAGDWMSSRSGQTKDEFNVLAHNDNIAKALQIMDPIHRRIHRAEYLTFSSPLYSLLASGSQGVLIDDQSSGIPFHMRFRTNVTGLLGAEYRVRLYEDVAIDPEAETTSPVNHNRRSGAMTGDIVFDGAQPGIVSGTLLFDTLVPPSESFESKEWIMSNDSDDFAGLILITNLSATASFFATISVDFYQAAGS